MTLWHDTLALEPTGSGHFRADISDAWNSGSQPNGGYLAALALNAMSVNSPFPDAVASSAFYLSAAAVGEADIEVKELRVGRSTASYEASVIQGKLRTRVTATFADLGSTSNGIQFKGELPPTLSPKIECDNFPHKLESGVSLRISEHIEMLINPNTDVENSQMLQTAWWRFADGADPDGLSAVLAVDSFIPVVFALGVRTWCPTLELSTYLRARPAPGWLRVQRRTRLLSQGFFDEDASVWDSNDVLVMQSRQLAKMGV